MNKSSRAQYAVATASSSAAAHETMRNICIIFMQLNKLPLVQFSQMVIQLSHN